ncbi:MAG: UDP-3-O-acyl-N-acetylglucosamine deacetylase [Prochlorotrichaceae cyanobacterium]|jgi:UDP-3-O-[3-hydroxymyristoyl] N-acetylglucosamine deacetylase
MPNHRQCTLTQPVTLSGVGLHSGETCQVHICPGEINTGIYFCCSDATLGTPLAIPARVDVVAQTVLSTELAHNGQRIRTVEHLLAALVGLGITNAQIQLEPARPLLEIPLLDGSAQEWVRAIVSAGIVDQGAEQPPLIIQAPLTVQAGEAFVVGLPSPETRLTYGIDFPVAAIGEQWYSLQLTPANFQTEIAPARTFGFRQQIEQAQAAGLIKGGSLENAIVCDQTGWLNPPLRFENEPVRHKILDLMGDLSLLGRIPVGHILAYKASHQLHVEFAQQLQQVTGTIA